MQISVIQNKLVQIICRIYLAAVDTNFKVQMCTGGESRTSYVTDGLSLTYRITNGNRQRSHMAIQRGIGAVVLNYHIVSIAAAAAAAGGLAVVMRASADSHNNGTATRSDNGCAVVSAGNVQSAVECTPT